MTEQTPGTGETASDSTTGPGPGSGIRIRLVRPDEAAAVGRLTEAAYANDYELSDGYRAQLVDVATRARDDEVWVAEDVATGAILGTVWTPRPGATLSPVALAGEMDFRLLATAPDARGRGVGEALTRHVIALGHERGATRVVLNSGPEMTGAHRLYERLGFRRLPEREGMREVQPGIVVELLAFGYDLGAGERG